jgi:quercetin dioxygenase-like cupin family protein
MNQSPHHASPPIQPQASQAEPSQAEPTPDAGPPLWADRAFQRFALVHGPLCRWSEPPHPTSLWAWAHDRLVIPESFATHFGFVLDGGAELICPQGRFTLRGGMFFVAVGPFEVEAGVSGGRGLVVSSHHHRGWFQLGGPIEPAGRLRYIDGCTDTLLVGPPVRGDPCLNLLHIPPGTHQTRHTHPSLRAGLIVSGAGRCVTPQAEHPLEPGTAFVIPPNGPHSFHTDERELLVIAYHPDSDTGPDHADHPMVNRTIVQGVPASKRPEIATRWDEPSNGEDRA